MVIADLNLKQVDPWDFVGRYGGEEFILFLPKLDIEEALHKVERIRQFFETQKTPWEGSLVSVTASFGLTALKCATDNILITFAQMVRGSHSSV